MGDVTLTEAAAASRGTTLARLVRLARPVRGRLALTVLLGTGTVAASIGLLATSGRLISHAALQPPLLDLMIAITAVRALGIARGLLRYLERLVGHDATLRLLADVRATVVGHLQRLVPAGVGDLRRGDLLSRLLDDVESMQTTYLRALLPPAVGALGIGVAVTVTAVFSGRASLVLLAGLLGVGVGVSALAVRLGRRSGARLSAARGLLAIEVHDLLAGLGELVVYGRVEDRLARIDDADRTLERLQRREAWRTGLVAGLASLVAGVTTVAVTAVAVTAVRDGTLGGIELALVALTALAAFEAVVPLPPAAVQLSDGLAAAQRVFDLLDAPDPRPEPASPRPRPAGDELRLESAWLRYEPDLPPALDGVDLTLRRGRRVALVGPSGAGKSTIAEVLTALRPLQQGRALLDGIPLDELAGDDVRALVGLVEQQPYLFATSIRENLRLAAPDAVDAALLDVLDRVRLGAWVGQLPEGLDTQVGDEGARLSGGQRRRLALARILLRDPPLLVLDEPTGDLDPVTARAVRRELLQATADRGVLLITHELPAADEVDEVIVLHRGRVVHHGPPDTLPHLEDLVGSRR